MSNLQLIKNLSNKQHSNLSESFFHCSNIEKLQKSMVSRVLKLSNKRISYQSESHLLNIMFFVFREYPHVLNINQLNEIVLDITVPMILEGVSQHIQFLNDKNNIYTPIDRASSTTIKGENAVVFKQF